MSLNYRGIGRERRFFFALRAYRARWKIGGLGAKVFLAYIYPVVGENEIFGSEYGGDGEW